MSPRVHTRPELNPFRSPIRALAHSHTCALALACALHRSSSNFGGGGPQGNGTLAQGATGAATWLLIPRLSAVPSVDITAYKARERTS